MAYLWQAGARWTVAEVVLQCTWRVVKLDLQLVCSTSIEKSLKLKQPLSQAVAGNLLKSSHRFEGDITKHAWPSRRIVARMINTPAETIMP